MLDIQLFGTIEVKMGGEPLRSLSAKAKLLVAYLALHPGRSVATSVIADAVFPDSSAADPHDLIKKTASEIRRALDEEGYRLSSPGPRLLCLDLEGANVDWVTFQLAVGKADPGSLQHAITLHARPLLETEPLYWAIDEQGNCLQLRQKALASLFRGSMDAGDMESSGNWLLQMLKFELPDVTLDEGLWREFMEALLAKQEYGKVQLHYMRVRTFLEQTAGRMPEAATQAIYQHIPKSVLFQMVQAGGKKKRGWLPDSAKLPQFPFGLIGRDAEKRELRSLFDHVRLVTVVGIGGMGKTRLAVQAGHEFGATCKDGVGFIDLSPCISGSVLSAFTKALGVKDVPNQSPYASLVEFLAPKCVLLIIDNCEHVVEEVAGLITDLLRDCPNLYLLATSREMLRISGEQVFGLHPLALPKARNKRASSKASPLTLVAAEESPAVRLFVERAVSVSPKFSMDESNFTQIAELCRLIDGLPLGIEMVASQIVGIPLDHIVAGLSDSLLELRHQKRGVTPRHQSLTAALDWSYSRLNESEKILLRHLSVFAGGWTLEAAERVCSNEHLSAGQVARALSELVTKSLVVMEPPDRYSPPYRFLDTIGAYAAALSKEHNQEHEHVRLAHCEYYISLLEGLGDMSKIKEYFSAIDQNLNNIQNATQWAFDHPDYIMLAHRLAMAMHSYWAHHGSKLDAREWHRGFLMAHRDRLPPEAIAASMLKIVDCCTDLSEPDSEEAVACRQNALEIYRSLGNRKGEADIYFALGVRQSYTRQQEESYLNFQKAYNYYEHSNEPQMLAFILIMIGGCYTASNRHKEAESVQRKALEIARSNRMPSLEALGLMFRGFSARDRQLWDLAQEYFGQSADVYRSIDSQWGVVRSLSHLADIKRRVGDLNSAGVLLHSCLSEASEFANSREAVAILVYVARLQHARLDWESSLSLHTGLLHLRDAYPDELLLVADEIVLSITEASKQLTSPEVEAIRMAAQTAGLETLIEYSLGILQQ